MLSFSYGLKARALSQYMAYDFNSAVNFNGALLAASEDGLFECGCYDLDDEADIQAYFEPVTTDFAVSNPKRLRFMYFGYEAQGDLEVSIRTDDQAAVSYSIDSTKENQQRKRIAIQRSQYGRYWRFRFSNVDGCDFSFDNARALITFRNEGHE